MHTKILIMISMLVVVNTSWSAEHHSGHVGGSSNAGGDCVKAHLSTFFPEHLQIVKPATEFSFKANNINHPKQISVTVKDIPVPVTTEFKDPYYLVKGVLPEALQHTTARINIKVKGKSSFCDVEKGWLVNISE
ncbi:MAG: hypothetical protein K9K84_09080 [Methylovulum sp.]|jgi:hypothetical protein|nr:hypothetical protein [Methylovulum sp.]